MRLRSHHRPWLAAALAASSLGCQRLPPIRLGECGNGVVEPERGEDCDRYAPSGQRCGQADEGAAACRFLADDTHACPEGTTAGHDGLCRRPSGTFAEAAGSGFPSVLSWHALADLNADGLPDLVGLSAQSDAFAIHWGDGLGGFGARADLSTGTVEGPPATGPLVGDAADDAILPLRRGMIVLGGSQTRTVQPTAYSTLAIGPDTTRSLVFPVNDAPTHSVPIVLTETPRGVSGNAVAVLPGRILQGVPLPIASGVRLGALAGRPARANLEPAADPRNIAEEMAVGFVGDARIYVLALSGQLRPGAAVTAELNLRQTVELPAPLAGAGLGTGSGADATTFTPEDIPESSAPSAVRFADADADGRLDLWAAVQAPGAGVGLVVAKLGPDGRFGEPAVDARATEALNRDRPILCAGADSISDPTEARLRVPLAIADFNENGAPDVVLPWGVVQDPGLAGGDAPCAWAPNGPIASAVTGDFNRDGHADLAVTTPVSTSLIFAFGSGSGGFNIVSVPAAGAIDRLRVGDFDGDFVEDVAYTEAPVSAFPGDRDAEQPRPVLRVAFGRPDGRVDLVESRAEMGEFDPIQGLETYREDGLRQDVTDDLMLTTAATEATGTRAIASLVGTPQRQMLSPMVLQRGSTSDAQLDTAVRVVAGAFEGPRGGTDLLAIARPPLERGRDGPTIASGEPAALLYLVQSEDGALSPGSAEAVELDCAPGFVWEHALVLSGDVDGDGATDVVAIDERADLVGSLFGQSGEPAPVADDGRVTVLVLRSGSEGWTCDDAALPDVETATTAATLGDFDADGHLDLALAHSGPIDADTQGRLTLYRGDGRAFDLKRGTEVALPEPPAGAFDEGTYPIDVVTLEADGDAGDELALSMFDLGLYLVDPTPAQASTGEGGAESPSVSPLLTGTDVVLFPRAGDVNADGLTDLVVRGLSDIRVLLGVDALARTTEAP